MISLPEALAASPGLYGLALQFLAMLEQYRDTRRAA